MPAGQICPTTVNWFFAYIFARKGKFALRAYMPAHSYARFSGHFCPQGLIWPQGIYARTQLAHSTFHYLIFSQHQRSFFDQFGVSFRGIYVVGHDCTHAFPFWEIYQSETCMLLDNPVTKCYISLLRVIIIWSSSGSLSNFGVIWLL